MIQAVETLLVKFAVFVVNHSFFICVCVPRWYHLGTVVPGGITKYGEKNNGTYVYAPPPKKNTLQKIHFFMSGQL